MSSVKPQTRPYRSRKRAEQAARTRGRVLAAAHRLILSEGWAGATIAVIASRAGVSTETVYATFGGKKSILEELVLRAVRGATPETPLTEQATPRAIAGEPNQARQIDLFSDDIAKVLRRVAPLMNVARVAAEGDSSIADLYAGLHRGRRRNLEWFAGALVRNGPLRAGMDEKTAAGIVWRLASPDLFLLMRRVEGVSLGGYADWLAATLKTLLLDDGAGRSGK